MDKFIRVVTVTGADDSIKPKELLPIAEEFPFVEFGILLMDNEGHKKFPSRKWLEELYKITKTEKLRLSGHLCGRWVHDICVGEPTYFEEMNPLWKMFTRFQLNFHGEKHHPLFKLMKDVLNSYAGGKEVIFQMDGQNDKIFEKIDYFSAKLFTAHPLYDTSGGAGILPKSWPAQKDKLYSGYAGGLSPQNVAEEIQKISLVAPGPIWTDAEKKLYSEDGKRFDLIKVSDFLRANEPWVIKG